jgi:hypothetical protein
VPVAELGGQQGHFANAVAGAVGQGDEQRHRVKQAWQLHRCVARQIIGEGVARLDGASSGRYALRWLWNTVINLAIAALKGCWPRGSSCTCAAWRR